MREDNKDYAWAISLIFLGSIFMLNTTGLLPWEIWEYIWRFWPIFLIIAGLRLILGKSVASNIIIAFVAFFSFLTIGTCAYTNSTGKEISFLRGLTPVCEKLVPTDIHDIEESFNIESSEYDDVESVEYDFDFGISEFTISDGSNMYLDLDATFTNHYGEPQIEDSMDDSVLKISMKENSKNIYLMNLSTPQYDILIGTDVRKILNINNGVGSGSIVLNNTGVDELNVNTGTGKVDITLSEQSIPEEVILDIGTGDIELNIPSNVGFTISYDIGVGEISVGDDTLANIAGSKKDIKSSNYDDASKVFVIDANIGVGNLKINFINN